MKLNRIRTCQISYISNTNKYHLMEIGDVVESSLQSKVELPEKNIIKIVNSYKNNLPIEIKI